MTIDCSGSVDDATKMFVLRYFNLEQTNKESNRFRWSSISQQNMTKNMSTSASTLRIWCESGAANDSVDSLESTSTTRLGFTSDAGFQVRLCYARTSKLFVE